MDIMPIMQMEKTDITEIKCLALGCLTSQCQPQDSNSGLPPLPPPPPPPKL